MKLTITLPYSLNTDLEKYIEARFGPGHPRLKSALICAALRNYINLLHDLYPNPKGPDPSPLEPPS